MLQRVIAGLFLIFQTAAFSETETIKQDLIEKFGYSDVDKQIVKLLIEDLLVWKAPTVTPSEVDTIVAYAFGNRMLSNGNRLPGPVNQELADLVVKLHKESGARVYAQWEIAEAIGDRIPEGLLTSINPYLDEKFNIVYLTTMGMAQKILAKNKPEALGKVAVIGFHDHVRRCVETSRVAGMNAYMVKGYEMPTNYDPLSAQPWTCNRLAFLEHELVIRLETIAGYPW